MPPRPHPVLAAAAVLACAAVVACGDNGDHGADAATAGDATPVPDAMACEPDQTVAFVVDPSINSFDFVLALDGAGSRCEQLIAAILDPARCPPGFALLAEDGGVDVQCISDVADFDQLDLRQVAIGGARLYSVSDLLVQVSSADHRIFNVSGTYFNPTAPMPGPGCLPVLAMHDVAIGEEITYDRGGGLSGTYRIRGDDEFHVGAPGFYAAGFVMHRVRPIEVTLLPAHVTDEIWFSDANCCPDSSRLHCVGARLYVDVFTGETLDQEPLCALSLPQ